MIYITTCCNFTFYGLKFYKELCEEIGEVRFWAVMGVGLAVVAWAYRINL